MCDGLPFAHFKLMGANVAKSCDELADGGLVPIQHPGELKMIVSSFQKYVNQISFSLAAVFVDHKQLPLLGHDRKRYLAA
jgi:hypothetical protein